MLSAKLKPTGKVVLAHLESKSAGPFLCPECSEVVILKTGRVRTSHFAHLNPIVCKFAAGESDEHRRCKLEIYNALLKTPGVRDVILERPLGTNRPDVSATINGAPVAIEVQISTLSLDTIIHRTQEYERKGIYVLWLPQWSPYLDGVRYSPPLWEKWIHAAYFGQVYYWIKGLEVAGYRFEPHLNHVPKTSWYSATGKKVTAGGYSRKSKRYRIPIRGEILNLAKDFVPKQREWWKGGDLVVPFAKLYIHQQPKNWAQAT